MENAAPGYWRGAQQAKVDAGFGGETATSPLGVLSSPDEINGDIDDHVLLAPDHSARAEYEKDRADVENMVSVTFSACRRTCE